MFAVRIDRYGPPQSLYLGDVPTPAPGPQDVLVRVRAVGVNRLDLLLREGEVFRIPLPRIAGTDLAGEIVAVGEQVPSERIGERVFAAPILSCGHCAHCLRGDDNLCAQFGTLGSTIDGGYAEYVRLPARNAIPLPASMDWVRAASFGLTYATAAAMLRRGRLQAGESVLVFGANGGLGHAAVELAHEAGARVIAVSRKRALHAALIERGAHAVVEPGPDMPDAVREATGGRGADLAFEHVGAATFEHAVAALAMDGRLVLGGVTTGSEATLDLKAVFTKRLEVLGCRGSGRRDLDAVLALAELGRVNPHVAHVLPLAQAAHAQALLEHGLLGKIVLTV
ncbi:alcohol dehydrogenase catalytic domain-containing protein [Trinickia sp. NRRL B-1857]|uniref:alcohol dehydrogenase catalytic domain-containing protein n=1 Tax=Trinickia sp. NRRL B-1857 TaxID=3162879 RepID=UPI003D2DAA5C